MIYGKRENVENESGESSFESGKSIEEDNTDDGSAISNLFIEVVLESTESVDEFRNQNKVFRSRFENKLNRHEQCRHQPSDFSNKYMNIFKK